MPLDGVFIGEKSLQSGSGSELRGIRPLRVGFGGSKMATAHWFSRSSWEKWSDLVRVFRGYAQQWLQIQWRKGVRIGASDPIRFSLLAAP